MSDDIKVEEEQQPQLDVLQMDDEVEAQARSQGWLPPEEAVEKGLDPSDAVSAQSYLDRGPLMRQIKLLNQRNKTMAKQFESFQRDIAQARVAGYEQALTELEAQRDQAYDDLDSSTVRRLDKEIEAKKAEKEKEAGKIQQTVEPELQEFVANNSEWWGKEGDTFKVAMAEELKLNTLDPTMDADDKYEQIQKVVDEYRASKNRTTAEPRKVAKEKVSFVAPANKRGGSAPKEADSYSFNDLTSGAKDTYMTMKNYYKDEFKKDYTVSEFVKNQKNSGYVKLEDIVKKG